MEAVWVARLFSLAVFVYASSNVASGGYSYSDQNSALADYDHDLSKKLLYTCAFCYGNVPKTCMLNAPAQHLPKKMEVVKSIKENCDELFDHCAAVVSLWHSEKYIVVAYRGTMSLKQLFTEFVDSILLKMTSFHVGGKVLTYFFDSLVIMYRHIAPLVTTLLKKYPGYKVVVTGHSLGGALASLTSSSLVKHGLVERENVLLYTYGQPRVGDKDYARQHDAIVPHSFRVVHYKDCVPHLPTSGWPTYAYHHGSEVFYPSWDMTSVHYMICRDGESKKCSNSVYQYENCATNHRHYFNINVSYYCIEREAAKRNKKRKQKKQKKHWYSYFLPGK